MIVCQHPRAQEKPLCVSCYRALTDAEQHYFIVALQSKQARMPLVTAPHSSITPERAREIEALVGVTSEVAPVVAKVAKPVSGQGSLFGGHTGADL